MSIKKNKLNTNKLNTNKLNTNKLNTNKLNTNKLNITDDIFFFNNNNVRNLDFLKYKRIDNIYDFFKNEVYDSFKTNFKDKEEKFDNEFFKEIINYLEYKNFEKDSIKKLSIDELFRDYNRSIYYINGIKIKKYNYKGNSINNSNACNFNEDGKNNVIKFLLSFGLDNINFIILIFLLSQQHSAEYYNYISKILFDKRPHNNLVISGISQLDTTISYLNIVNNNILSLKTSCNILRNYKSNSNIIFVYQIIYINIQQNKNYVSYISIKIPENFEYTKYSFKKLGDHILNNFNSPYYIHKFINDNDKSLYSITQKQLNIIRTYLYKKGSNAFNRINGLTETFYLLGENNNINKYDTLIELFLNSNNKFSFENINLNTKSKFLDENNNSKNFLYEIYYIVKYGDSELVKVYIFINLKNEINNYNCELFSHIVNIDYEIIKHIKSSKSISESINQNTELINSSKSISESINQYLDSLLKINFTINKSLIWNNFTIQNNFNNITRTITNIKKWININKKSKNNFNTSLNTSFNTSISSKQINNHESNNKLYNKILKKYNIKQNSDFLIINLNNDSIYNYKEKDFIFIILKILIEEPKIIVICSQKDVEPTKEKKSFFKKIISFFESSEKESSLKNYFHDCLKVFLEEFRYILYPESRTINKSNRLNELKTTIYTKKINMEFLSISSIHYKNYIKTDIRLIDENSNTSNEFIIINISNNNSLNTLKEILNPLKYIIKQNRNNIFICGKIYTDIHSQKNYKNIEKIEDKFNSMNNSILNKFLNRNRSSKYIYYLQYTSNTSNTSNTSKKVNILNKINKTAINKTEINKTAIYSNLKPSSINNMSNKLIIKESDYSQYELLNDRTVSIELVSFNF